MLAARDLIRTLMVAVSSCAMYGREHVTVRELSQKITEMVEEQEGTTDTALDLKFIQGDVVVNGKPVGEPGTHGQTLYRRLKRKGVSEIRFLHGVTVDELQGLFANIASPEAQVASSAHISTGKVSVALGGFSLDGMEGSADDAAVLRSEQVDKFRDIYDDFSPFRQLNISGLEEIVVNFIVAFRKQANILSLISPVRSYSEYTYTHATNVSILSMFQAESLGFDNELLHDIGIGALLHDVGKLFISKDILEKKGKLDDREWEEIRRHPSYGARYLAKIDGLPRLAVILAFEHHLRYDGKGYPAVRMGRRKQSFCSQIVGLADFFDALRSRRPYKKDWEIKEILALMKENSGNEFNPVLVDNFARLMLRNPVT